MMEQLIGVYSVTYTDEPPRLVVENLVAGYGAALAGDEVAELRALLAPVQKRIHRFGERYNLITGASGDLALYDVPTGRRLVYFNSDEVVRLQRLLGI